MAVVIPWPYPDNGADDFIRNIVLPGMHQHGEHHWSITEKSDPENRLIGLISLYPNRKEDNRGFWIGLDYQRRGYMAEAVLAVNDYAFDVLNMNEMILNNAEPNTGSHRLKENVGAKVISDDGEIPYVGGSYRQIRWLLTREAWQANRHKLIKPVPV
jgi:RimJ/RimL family protein N-acetyltransferase